MAGGRFITLEGGAGSGKSLAKDVIKVFCRNADASVLHGATDHVARTIRPALARGAIVICDRYIDSTRAYQGAGHGLADAALCRLHDEAVGLWPDLTLVLQLGEAEGLGRAAARGGAEARYEAMGSPFHARISAFFAGLPAAEPERCRAIDAAGSVDDVAARIWAATC